MQEGVASLFTRLTGGIMDALSHLKATILTKNITLEFQAQAAIHMLKEHWHSSSKV